MTQLDPTTNSSIPISHALTALHLAVLANDKAEVRKIVGEREIGVEARTATGTTPFMLAAMYGRIDIFLFLTNRKASPNKKDIQGNNALDYVKHQSPFIQNLFREYKDIAAGKPDRVGRRRIYGLLKARQRDSNMAYAQGRADARAEPQPQVQLQTAGHLEHVDPQHTAQDPSARLVFLRSPNGKQQEVVEVRQIATAEHGNIGRKCTGFIRAVDGDSTHVFAISGWGSVNDKNAVYKNVLNNRKYTQLVRQVAALLNFELEGNWLDCRFPGTAAEKKGVFVACHSEKQLAIYVLTRALSHALGTKELTIENITLLKTQLDKVPPGLRETTIHLDHELVCRSCLQFHQLLNQKTGLTFRCESRDWYVPGERPKLRYQADGSYKPDATAKWLSGPNANTDIIDDELDFFNNDDAMNTAFHFNAMDQEGETLQVHSDPVTPVMPTSHRPSDGRQLVLRVPPGYEKKGSPVEVEPHQHAPRYTVPVVTPPSRRLQSLPTPQSNARATEIARITLSPSPAATSPGLGQENQSDSMSTSMSPEWEVEEILQWKEENGVHLYLVKWRGFPYDNNTWEPQGNLENASNAIAKFWEELQAVQSQDQDMDEQSPGRGNTSPPPPTPNLQTYRRPYVLGHDLIIQ